MKITYVLALAALSAGQLLAQTDRASLSGTVMDASGAAIPNATVLATSQATGLTRTVQSGGSGTYTLPSLPIGRYVLTFTAPGFQQTAVEPFSLEVGQTRTIDAHMAPAGVTTEANVSAGPALQEDSATVGGVIVPEQIQNLPVNGRNWTNLMALVPGAMDTGTGDENSIRFAGRGLDDNNYRFDGVDATGIQNQTQRIPARLQISTDAIAEFRASSALYGAESGGSAGGQIEVVTRSGTNRFHGTAFEFIRNDVFDARTFDNFGQRKPPFRMNQFGASFGGPILRDRTFFFLDFEAIRQTLGQSLFGLVPSASYRAATLAANPQLAPILNGYPIGQAPYQGSTIVSSYTSRGTQSLKETSGLFRVDHRFTDRTSAFVRFNLDRLNGNVPTGASGFFLRDRFASNLSPYNAIISVQHIFSPRVLNDVKLGFNRSDFGSANESVLPYAISVPQFTTLINNLAKVAVSNTYSILDNASFVFGRHDLKAGVEIRRVEINQSAGLNNDLTIAFASAADLQRNVVSSVTLNAALPLVGLRETQEFGYVQDKYTFRPNLILNAGLRYEYYSTLHEQKNRARVFDPATCGPTGFCPVGSAFYFPYPYDLEPRLSLSWDPRSDGKTVGTMGYGVYYGDGQLGDLNAPINNISTRELLQGSGLSFPVDRALANGLTSSASPRGLNRNRVNQQVQAWSVAVQQTLPKQTVFELRYLGTKGTHLFTRSYVNGINPLTGTRPIPTIGLVDYKSTDSNSIFHALEATYKHDFSHGLFFQANYQWSHTINDGSVGGGEALSAENVNCRRCERANSDQDIRNYFTASTVYRLPFGRGQRFFSTDRGITSVLASGWQFSAIGTARSGLPLNILVTRRPSDLPDGNNVNQRPDRVANVSQYQQTAP